MVGTGVVVEAVALSCIETCAVSLVIEEVLSKEAEDGAWADVGLDSILIVAVGVEEGNGRGAVTTEVGVLFKSVWAEGSIGLERAADAETVVVDDERVVGILEDITGPGGEGFVPTVQTGDTVTGALASPAAELREGFQEVEVCRLKLVLESNLAGGD